MRELATAYSRFPPRTVRPIAPVPLCAKVFSHDLRAFLTLDGAAPVELAVTAADSLDLLLLHFEATFMTEPPAASLLPLRQVPSALQTFPALGTVQAQAEVLHAVVRRVLQVDELLACDGAEGVRDGAAVLRTVASSHTSLVHLQLLRLVVFYLQIVAHVPEVRQLHPAGLNVAAPGHTVALAGPLHRGLDSLKL